MDMAKRLYRTKDSMLAGICGGIAEYFDLDPTLVRIGYIVLSIGSFGSAILAYLVLWVVIPSK